MSDLPGRGRHWRGENPRDRFETFVPGRVDTASSGHLPRVDQPYTPDEDPGYDPVMDSGGGLYRVPLPGDPEYTPPPAPREHTRPMNLAGRSSVPPKREPDLVVPRVYLEPDEAMDKLRARAFRWAIIRDVVIILVGGVLLWQWAVVPLFKALGF